MPITSSALGAMPPSSIQTFVNYSYCIDHLLKEINVTLNLNLNPSISFAPGRTGDWRRSLTACHNADTVAHTIAASASCCAVHASEALYSVSQERHCHYFLYVLLPLPGPVQNFNCYGGVRTSSVLLSYPKTLVQILSRRAWFHERKKKVLKIKNEDDLHFWGHNLFAFK